MESKLHLMIPLESLRWKELEHAYGAADDTPGLLQALAADEKLDETWHELWSSICHQYSVYSATFAAIPHLVALAEDCDFEKKVSIHHLIGAVCVYGTFEGEPLPEDIRQSADIAIKRMARISSAMLAHDFARSDSNKPDRYFLQAHLGLWLGKHPVISEIGIADCIDYGINVLCPQCYERLEILPSDVAANGIIDESARAQGLAYGMRLIDEVTEEEWTTDSMVEIAAALATKFGDAELATIIQDFKAEWICSACAHQFQILEGMILKAEE